MITLSEGTIFAQRYRVVRLIGQGGMGAVFEVVHVETERRCALKVMQPNMADNDAMRARFRQEAKVAALVNSEHIVDVYDAGIDEATQMPFLVMELLSGLDLRQHLKELGRLRPEDVALYVYQTALALERTHRSNIIHRDLKPENLFLTFRENGTPHIKILDFGVAKFTTEMASHTSATRDVGTPLFMGPEQFTVGAKPSPQTDIYALGMITYMLLTGVSYWADDSHLMMTIYAFVIHVVQGPPEPATVRALRQNVRLPPAFDVWFARATAKDPLKRFSSALVAANELADALGVPRLGSENSTILSNTAMRSALGSSTGTGLQSTGWTGTGNGSFTSEAANATGVPLATTAGVGKESNGRIVIAVIGIASFLVIGLIVIFIRETSMQSSVAAGSSNAIETRPSAEATALVAPSVVAIHEPTLSASAKTETTSAKTKTKSTSPAKPPTTSVAPKKDLFTRD